MILASMGLPEQSANPRLASADNNEQVFGNESISCQLIDDFHVCQSLLIGAYLSDVRTWQHVGRISAA